MLPIEQIKALMKVVAKASTNPSAPIAYSLDGQNTVNLTYAAAQETLRKELRELGGTNALYRDNKNTIFSLMEETVTEVLPARVMDRYKQFAETRTFKQGEQIVFTRRMGATRGKQFVTRAAPAGVYEVFKLGGQSFEIRTAAIGAACQIQFEEFLDGRADFAEVLSIIMEGMDEWIYREVARSLMASIDQLPVANKVVTNGFKVEAMDHLLQTAAAYGRPTIYCTYEFAVKIMPHGDMISESMKDKLWTEGYLGSFHGAPIIVLPQSFTDGSNSTKIIDPGFCWVIPSGADGKPVKIAFEGSAQSRDRENEDWSRDFQIYQKVGIGVMLTNNICSYVDTSLVGKLENDITSQWLPGPGEPGYVPSAGD